MIRDWWISIRFLCFVFQGSLFCDRPISGNNRLVTFVSQIFLIFLILVTSKNKATSASFLRQKIHSPSRFPSFPSQSRVVLSQAGRARYIVICINPAFTLMIDGTDWPKTQNSLRRLQYAQRDTTNFAVRALTNGARLLSQLQLGYSAN